MSALRKHHISFKHAFAGLFWAFRTQPNFRIHTVIALISIAIAFYVSLTSFEWILLVFIIFWGFAAELVNTALEAMTDLITTEWRKEAKIAKDVAAGMMLFVAFGAITTGLILLGPKLITKLAL